MRTNYHRQRNHRRHFSRVLLIFFIISLLITALSWFGALTGFMRSAYAYTNTGTVAIQNVTKNISSLFTPKTNLLQENQNLRTRLQELKISELHSKALAQENNELRELFINTEPLLEDAVLARIIDYSTAPYGTLLIKVQGGVEPRIGALAHFGKWAIGSIVEFTDTVALVNLFTASGNAYDVLVGDTVATFIGTSNGIGKIMLPRTEIIEIGTPVTIPSQKGFLLGTVESIEVTEEAALQTLFVRTPFNIRSVRFITIEKD